MSESIAFPLWAAAALAAVMALLVIIAAFRIGSRQVLGLVAAVVVVAGVGLLLAERLDTQDKVDQRRALEARASAIAAQALVPNSNLACLDAAGGDLVDEACEKALFSSPEQIAAALNYVGARLDLLRDIAMLGVRREAAVYEGLRAPILRSLEADRFGLVAQVLTARDGCSATSCYAFALVQHRDQLVANMNERAYDMRVVRFASAWSDKPTGAGGPALASQLTPPPPPASTLTVNFPSASSIPPVSIMSNEPGRPGQNGVETSARPEPRAQAPQSPRRPVQKAQASRPAPQPVSPPAVADPFPQPVGSAQQTTAAQPQPPQQQPQQQ